MFTLKKNKSLFKYNYFLKEKENKNENDILVIDNIKLNIFLINLINTQKIYVLKKYTDIHIDILNNNRKIIETTSIINGVINYTFLPKNMEDLIIQKYLYSKVSYENISEINELNNIYNISLEIYRENRLICKGFLNSEILLYNDNDDNNDNNKFIIELYQNKYLIDTKCLIRLVNVNLYNNKKINSNNF